MYARAAALLVMGILLTTNLHAQASSTSEINPISYDNVLWCGHEAHFSFEGLEDREVLGVGKMSFFAPEKVEMSFRIKVKSDGTVSYVAPPRCSPALGEYRKGGTSALYGYQFEAVSEELGDRWVNVLMTVGD